MQVENKCSECNTGQQFSAPNKEKYPYHLLQAVNDIVKKEEFVKHYVFIKAISTKGDSYLADLYEVNIKGETADGEKDINVFVKCIIPGENNKLLSVTDAYFKESFTYNELAQIFTELQSNANVPEEEQLNMAKSYDVTNTEAVFLENLVKKGFITYNRMDVIPLRLGELAVQQLAKFHGLFYVLEKKRPEYFEKNLKIWKHPFMGGVWQEFILNLSDITTKNLTKETKERVEKFKPKIYDKFMSYADSPGCTICHGDYRVPNMLIKELNGEITKVVPVDFQLLYYGCPINDLLYLLFNSTDQEFRRNHMTYLKDLYYNHLEKFLAYFDLDVNDIFPRKEFEGQFLEKLDFGLIFALFCIPFHFTEEDKVPDIGQDDMTKLNFVLNSLYNERIQGIVDDFIEWGYL